jgi:serine phosphatase RsbU (regulator of sigma subunit)
VDQLGFRLEIDYHYGEHGRFVLVAPRAGKALVALIAPKPGSQEFRLIGRSGQAVFVTEDVQRQFEAWRDRGVPFQHAPQSGAWGGIFTVFQDPDGNSFVLAGWDDLTREIEARRHTIAERLESERRAAQELQIAKEVQARLFPQTAPPLDRLDYAGLCIPARAVGGDYYDFLNLGRNRLGLVIGDISGKGIAAALLMANLQANLRSQCAMASDDPQQFLRSVNQLLYQNTPESAYATLFFGEYDDREECLRYANCGHVPGILLRSDDSVKWLDSTCTVLGLFKDWDCVVEECQLSQGDTLVLYTDGVPESVNDSGEEFGYLRLVEALRRHRGQRPGAFIRQVLDEVQRFSRHEQHDDITVLIAECRKGPKLPAISNLS